MPTGDAIDVVLKVLGYMAPVVGALAIWAITKYVRLLHVEKDCAELRKKLDAMDRAHEARFQRERETHLEVRHRFMALKATYLAQKEKLKGQSPAFIEQMHATFRQQLASQSEHLRQALDRLHRAEAGGQNERTREKDLEKQVAASREVIDALTREVEQAKNAATETSDDRDRVRQTLDQLEERLAEIARFDGRLWLREPATAIPAFRPLAERRTAIISVLNLKGGVGKTTIAANLGATLAKPDRPALLIDLDYQRSLSMLLVADRDRKQLHKAGDSVQHFLAGNEHSLSDLVGKVRDLSPDVPNCSILTNSDNPAGSDAADSLEETENRLMAEWLFDRGRPDVRFFLRQALHHADVSEHFGYVLLDCPPRLTTACVNALAASDYVLIPVLPDAVSTYAVENLLRTLKGLRESLLPELAILAIVPNMVRIRLQEPIRARPTRWRI